MDSYNNRIVHIFFWRSPYNFCKHTLYGARPLRKAIRSAIEDPAAELILSGKLSDGGTVYAKSQDGKIVLTASEERGTITPA